MAEKKSIKRNVYNQIRDLLASMKPEGKVELYNIFARFQDSPDSIIRDESCIIPVIMKRLETLNKPTFKKLHDMLNECVDKGSDPYWFVQRESDAYELQSFAYNRPPVDLDELVDFLLGLLKMADFNPDFMHDALVDERFKALNIDAMDIETLQALMRVLLLVYTPEELAAEQADSEDPLEGLYPKDWEDVKYPTKPTHSQAELPL